jgi:hypothetical protein
MKLKKENINKNGSKTKEIRIKRTKNKFNIKIRWNQMLKDIKIQKPTVKLTLFKKAKFILVIEFDIMVTCIKAS